MARKRSKRSRSSGIELSEGLRRAIVVIVLLAAALLLFFSFLGAAGSVGIFVNKIFADLFGFDRWLAAIFLGIFAWDTAFPERALIRPIQGVGILLFLLSFNGIVNLLAFGVDASSGDASLAGGAIGLLISSALGNALGFSGALIVGIAVFAIAALVTFETSIATLFSVEKKNTRVYDGENDEEAEDEDETIFEEETEDEYEEDREAEIDEEEEDDEDIEHGRAAPIIRKGEKVMTSKMRREMSIPVDILNNKTSEAKPGDIEKSTEIIQSTFENFGINVDVREVRIGPSVTQYALKPAQGIKLSRIVALQNDLALALAAHPIRIEAPIPGRSLVGIEVPNQSIGSVTLRELLESKLFKRRASNYMAPLGKDVTGSAQAVFVDKAPHMLVAGATGSGKSVCLNIIICALLYQNGPDDLKFIMVDPKRVELGVYAGIPHLLIPPITKVEEAINALKWGVREMERRLDHLAKAGVRDIDSYNEKFEDRMPKIVIVIDELADLMSQNKRDVEAVIVRIAQMARAAGIHLILATQRPSVDVITGTIKANIPTRLAFSVASQVDSKTILDISGAEKLLGRGDMLMAGPQLSKPRRVQGAYISDDEIKKIIDFLKAEGEPDYNYQITESSRTGGTSFDGEEGDDMFDEAMEVAVRAKRVSTSFLQRRLRIGYSRAARIIDLMEEAGLIGAANGSKPREVFVKAWPPEETEPQMEESLDDDQDTDDEVEEDDA
ncbi:MAG: DNA translocase FtsK 4TM domain-containing protein [bacterium]|nr:DNA translocase FtsK 4TM domain-containing protein [bacterium]MDA1024449.1 DNA translocase FtsK 4TM domain-containing protein [bacterium]